MSDERFYEVVAADPILPRLLEAMKGWGLAISEKQVLEEMGVDKKDKKSCTKINCFMLAFGWERRKNNRNYWQRRL